MLFLDARHTFRQVDRAHRDFLPEQIELLANVVRLYRGEDAETVAGSEERMGELFPDGAYTDVPGLCRIAAISEIEAQGWSLNPGRYVGAAAAEEDDGDFPVRLAELHDELTALSDEAEELRARVNGAVRGMLEA
jgi:type I restriction enzyme M protein